MAGKVNRKEVPWWETSSESELEEWYQENPEGFKEYLSAKWEEWNEIQQTMKPDQPHPLAYRQGESDPQYAVDLNIFINQQAVERGQEAVMERHRPAPQRGPVDRDFLALSSRDKKDRKIAAEILRHRDFIGEQLKRAVECEALGDEKGKREATARAAMMTRQVEQQRKEHRYTFLEQADEQLVKNATSELEAALDLSPTAIQDNLEYYQGLVTAFNATHDGEFSYLIDGPSQYDPNRSGEPRIIKVEHGGLRACDVTRTAENRSMSTLDHLITVGFGKTPEVEKEEVVEEETPSPQEWEASLQKVG